jgi:hypothetical protein
MKYIRHILEKFSIYYKNLFSSKTENKPEYIKEPNKYEEEYLCGISFKLTKNFDVDILGFIPETDKLSPDEISDIAEKYAQLLLSINKGFLKSKVLSILDDKANRSSEPNEQLFLNNVVVYYDLLKEEISKLQNSNTPLIRPISVFRSK